MRCILALVAALVSLLVLSPAAGATESHPFTAETNGTSTVGGNPPTGAFEDACGVAIDSHGDRYVADYYHDAIDVFGPGGGYLTQIAEESDGNGPCGLAVDGEGNLYVQNWRAEVIRYTPSAYPPASTTTYGERTVIDSSGTATGLAVDPATGDLYVDDGAYLAEFEAPVHADQTPTRIGEGQIGEGYGLALSSFASTAGDLYVPDAASGTVRVFGPAGEALPSIDGAGTPQGGFDHLVDAAVAVDPGDGDVFVADNLEHGASEHPAMVIDEFKPTGAFRGQISRWITHPAGEPGVIVEHALQDAEPSGLVIDSAGNVLATSGNSDNSEAGQLDKNGKPVEGSLLYTFGATAPAKALTVTRSGSGAGTVTSAPAGIACGSACAAEYDEGAKVTLTAGPDPHSAFGGWSGEGCAGTASTCLVTMSQARTVNAEFAAIPQQALQVGVGGGGEGTVTSSPAGIDCTAGAGACSEEFNQGSTVTLTAEPAPHNRFAGWGTPECDESLALTCDVSMTGARAVAASFAPIPPRTLALEVAGPGSGEVRSSPAGIACPGACSSQFDSEGPESIVTLTAVPAPHDEVIWSGCAVQPGPAECDVTMSAARSVKAIFAPILHTLTVGVVGAGSVGADSGAISGCTASAGACSGSYQEGTVITLSAAAAAGSAFAGWSGACGGVGPCHLTIEADTAVTANFAAVSSPPIEPGPAQLTLGKLAVKGAAATLKLSVSGPGTVLAGGSGLKRAVVHARAAGILSLPLVLSRAGEHALARSKHHRLTVTTTVTFTPSDGAAAVTATRTVAFGSGGGGGHRKHHRHRSKPRRH